MVGFLYINCNTCYIYGIYMHCYTDGGPNISGGTNAFHSTCIHVQYIYWLHAHKVVHLDQPHSLDDREHIAKGGHRAWSQYKADRVIQLVVSF